MEMIRTNNKPPTFSLSQRVHPSPFLTKKVRKGEGFTLIELLIVISIVAVLATVGIANLFGTRNRIVFKSQVAKIAGDLQFTRERSRTQESGDQWGIHFENPAGAGSDFYDIWRGANYATGTTISHFVLSPGVEFTVPGPGSTLDVVFAKATGLLSANSTINIQSTQSSTTAIIEINIQGRVDYTLN